MQQAGLAEVDLDAGLVVLPRELAEPFPADLTPQERPDAIGRQTPSSAAA